MSSFPAGNDHPFDWLACMAGVEAKRFITSDRLIAIARPRERWKNEKKKERRSFAYKESGRPGERCRNLRDLAEFSLNGAPLVLTWACHPNMLPVATDCPSHKIPTRTRDPLPRIITTVAA